MSDNTMAAKGTNWGEAPLASGLRWITVILAAFVISLGAMGAFLSLKMSNQVALLRSVDAIDAARSEVIPMLAEMPFLPTASQIKPIVRRLQDIDGHLAQFDTLDHENPQSAQSLRLIAASLEMLAAFIGTSNRAFAQLDQLNESVNLYRGLGAIWKRRADTKRAGASAAARKHETDQRALNTEMINLSSALFAASRIREEIDGFARFSRSDAGQTVPITKVHVSTEGLPRYCKTPGDATRECTPSTARVHTEIDALANSPPERINGQIIATQRALGGYIRAGEARFQILSEDLSTLLDATQEERKKLGRAGEILDRLNMLARVYAETDDLLYRLSQGSQPVSSEVDQLLRTNFERMQSINSDTADLAAIDRTSNSQIDGIGDLISAAWDKVKAEVIHHTELKTSLSTAIKSLNETLEQMAEDTRTSASVTAGLLSSAAIGAMLLLGLLASLVLWGGQTFVVRPLAKTTQTIVALADRAPIGRVHFNRRSFGLGILEDALERLRLANVEREELTRRTIEQRAAIEQNLKALADKSQELEHLARHDALTDLPNRRYADEYLAQFSESGPEDQRDFTLLHVDLDRFKEINDTLGHEAGDTVLRHVSSALKDLLGEGDKAFRIGGDEFLIIRTGQESAKPHSTLAMEIIETLNHPVDHKGHSCRIGASIGIAHGKDAGFDGREVLVNADIALYEAKSRGRNRHVEFSKTLQEKTVNRKTLSDRLLIALENEEFVPYYQPQFFSDTLDVRGLETLCRWHHPDLGVLSPDAFMEQAEASNLVGKIDHLLLRIAARDMALLRERGIEVPKISFNVTADRLTHADFAQSLVRHVGSGTKIAIELLESMSLDNLSETVRWAIDNLKDNGIEIEIDDFGSCRASIAGLIAVSPDAMKIDGAIVGPITQSPQHLQLVRAIIDIGRTLGIEVIAERVETMRHVEILREQGCNVLQGFALAKPMAVEDLAQFLYSDHPVQQRLA